MIGDSPPRERRPLLAAAAVGVLVAAGLAALVLALGSWAYQHRQFTLHDGRLKRLVEQHPGLEAVTRGVLSEPGNRPIPMPESEQRLRDLAAQWSPARADEVMAKRRRWPTLRIFGAGEMVYFLYFDAEGRLQDYVLLSAQ